MTASKHRVRWGIVKTLRRARWQAIIEGYGLVTRGTKGFRADTPVATCQCVLCLDAS